MENVNKLIEQLNIEGVISFVPSGNSMWPTLKSKGQSVIAVKKQGRLNEFDVALFTYNGSLVLHRVIEVTDTGYITCGDGMLSCERVEEQSVIGVLKGFYIKDKFIEVTDQKYIDKTKKWYSNPKKRQKRINRFHFSMRVKGKLKRIFCKKGDKNV